jgi:predicted phage terminase large subunit-like protein
MFKLTPKQLEAQDVLSGPSTHEMLFGGSRSGKTFLHVRNIVLRALLAKKSRHCMLRFRFNHIKSAIIFDTFPKVMEIAFPNVDYDLNKSEWYVRMQNDSELWFGGLDDKQRTEKILGNEYATIFLNECSQISYSSVTMVITRLAQRVMVELPGMEPYLMKNRMFYDCNPPNKLHWTYKLFVKKVDPETKAPLTDPDDYISFRMNPNDNIENLSEDYLRILRTLPTRQQKRFLFGEFADANPNALFPDDILDKWRVIDSIVPQMLRIVVAVDPSGSDNTDNIDNDPIGIIIAGLGIDGNAYILEDCTVKAGPGVWGRVATTAFDRHKADCIVGETNYGGAMVKAVIQTARPHTPFHALHASRGKAVRAEPISALVEEGRVRLVGYFRDLEEELSGFSTMGFAGDHSPNRADAFVWAVTSLFPGIVNPQKKQEVDQIPITQFFNGG